MGIGIGSLIGGLATLYSAKSQSSIASKAISSQQSMIGQQEKAKEEAKKKALASSRAALMGESRTKYTTALGSVSTPVTEKKTLLGG